MALARITDDVLFVIVDALKVEDIILLGAASRRLRTITTNERRVWAPRLLTNELGLGTVGLDAAACASLASLGCTPRRLLLQSLPWRMRRRDPPLAHRRAAAFSWRPRDNIHWNGMGSDFDFPPYSNQVPKSLLITDAQDFVVCEVYEREESADAYDHIRDGFAHKVVRLTDCDLAGFPENWNIPLDLPISSGHKNGSNNTGPWFELRLFALVGGALAPIADTGDMDGVHDDRYCRWSTLRLPDKEYGKSWIDVEMTFDIDSDDQGDARFFRSVQVILNEYEQDGPPRSERRRVINAMLTRGIDGFQRFFRRCAVCAQPRELFATDSMTPFPGSPDAHSVYGPWQEMYNMYTYSPALPDLIEV
jgi:hypothetical protein